MYIATVVYGQFETTVLVLFVDQHVPYQVSPKVCSYKMVAISGYDVLSFPPVKPLPPSYGDTSSITVSIPPNKHFNLTITEYNGYGNTSTTVVISEPILNREHCLSFRSYTHPFLVGTFDVVGVSVNTSSPTGLLCLFNPGSLATGCLVYLTDTHTGVTYCRVVVRSLDTPVNMSFCPSSPSNGPLGTGVYSVEVYDIESDGGVSSVPALAGEMVTVYGPSIAYRSTAVYVPSVYIQDSTVHPGKHFSINIQKAIDVSFGRRVYYYILAIGK